MLCTEMVHHYTCSAPFDGAPFNGARFHGALRVTALGEGVALSGFAICGGLQVYQDLDRAQHGLGRERSGGQAKMLVQVTKFEQGLGHAATS